VKIFGDFRSYPGRRLRRSSSFSDHAEYFRNCSSGWRTFTNKPSVTYLVHGEPAASSQLCDAIKKELGWNVQVAEYLGAGWK